MLLLMKDSRVRLQKIMFHIGKRTGYRFIVLCQAENPKPSKGLFGCHGLLLAGLFLMPFAVNVSVVVLKS